MGLGIEEDETLAIVLCTAPKGASDEIAKAVIEEHLAACVNVLPTRSYFSWEGKHSCEEEELMIMKTSFDLLEPLSKRIKEMHSYEIPEILVLPVLGGDEDYLLWAAACLRDSR